MADAVSPQQIAETTAFNNIQASGQPDKIKHYAELVVKAGVLHEPLKEFFSTGEIQGKDMAAAVTLARQSYPADGPDQSQIGR